MRPVYETKEDRTREQQVFDAIADKFSCQCIVTPKLSVADRLLCNRKGELVAIAELKIRTNPYKKYPTYMLSAHKHEALTRMGEALKVPALLVVKFSDSLKVTTLKDTYLKEVGGRYDRGDSKDVEQCIYIPIGEFKTIEVKVNHG